MSAVKIRQQIVCGRIWRAIFPARVGSKGTGPSYPGPNLNVLTDDHLTMKTNHSIAALTLGMILQSGALAEYRVVAVGIDKYREAGKDLSGCVNDMESFVAALQKHYQIPASAVTALTNTTATKAAIAAVIEEKLAAPSTPEDTVVFYYAGHGDFTQDLDGDEEDQMDEALIPTDGDPKNPGTWLTDDELARLLAKIKTPNVLMVIDSCHSGTLQRTATGLAESRTAGFGNRRAATTSDGKPIVPDKFSASLAKSFPNHVVITACDSTEEANEVRGKEWEVLGKAGHKDGGLFTTVLVEVLDKNPTATMGEIKEAVRKVSADFIAKLGKKPQIPQFDMPKAEARLAAYLKGEEKPPATSATSPPPQPPPAPNASLTADGVITSGAIKLQLKTNGRVFTAGDKLKVELSSDQDCFVRIYYLSADNKVVQIFPNQFQQENAIKKGGAVHIPGPTAGFELQMSKPFGNEVLKVVASTVQFTDLEDDAWAQQLFQTYNQTDLQSMSVRGIKAQARDRKFGEAVLIYSVKDKSQTTGPPAPANAPPSPST